MGLYAEIYYQKNRKRLIRYGKMHYEKTKNQHLEYSKEYYKNNKEKIYAKRLAYHLKNPWLRHLYGAQVRCNHAEGKYYKYYGGKGIKCLLTINQIRKLYERDKACKLKRPSLDRKDSNKSYTFGNCQFIEMSENCRNGRIKLTKKLTAL